MVTVRQSWKNWTEHAQKAAVNQDVWPAGKLYPSVCQAPWALCRYSDRTNLAERQCSVLSGPWWRPWAPFPQGGMGNLDMRRAQVWNERTSCLKAGDSCSILQTMGVAAERRLRVWGRQVEVEVSCQILHPYGRVFRKHCLTAGQLLLQISDIQLQKPKVFRVQKLRKKTQQHGTMWHLAAWMHHSTVVFFLKVQQYTKKLYFKLFYFEKPRLNFLPKMFNYVFRKLDI